MKARPILMSGPMVQALLDGRKTQTRRILKQPRRRDGCKLVPELLRDIGPGHACPYGIPGDLLYVRETHCEIAGYEGDPDAVCYRADNSICYPELAWERESNITAEDLRSGEPWTPSIFMQRHHSRLTLELTETRCQLLNDISEEEALAEGVVQDMSKPYKRFHVPGVDHPNKSFPELSRTNAREMYAALFDTINGSGEWLANPWVWVLLFRVHHCNVIAFMAREA